MEKKHLSPIASDVLRRCAQKLDISVNALLEEFEANWKPENGDYPRKLVEFCSSKALDDTCCNIEEKINGGSFSRFSFDIMLAREKPTSADEEQESFLECVAKEKEE